MRVSYRALKKIIREVALSPSVFKNNHVVQDPMDRPNIAQALTALEQPFKTGLETNLVLDARDSYDEETRELDDAEYARIKDVAAKATELMLARAHKAVQASWAEAMKGVGSADKATVQKKVA